MTAKDKKAFVLRMAKARRKGKKNPTTSAKKNPAKRNPARAGKKNPGRRNPHRNPLMRNANYLSDPKQIGINIVTALLSAVATRQLPQMVLGVNNTGWKGYGANVAATVAAAFAASEFIGPSAAQAAILGGGVIVLDRLLTEQFSPVGNYLSLTGLGDATAATALGQVTDGYYLHPTIYNPDGSPLIPHEITDASVRQFNSQPAPARVAPAGRQLAGVSSRSRFPGRFN